MITRYVVAELIRNPRRTIATVVGVALGVGLFCAVLFFVDGLSASMTQRAIAPLTIDMQRIVTVRVGGSVRLTQTVEPTVIDQGDLVTISLSLTNSGDVAANEVTVRSVAESTSLQFVPRSARVDNRPITTVDDNPFAHGAGRTGYNIGTIEPGTTVRLTYLAEALMPVDPVDSALQSSYSTRESLLPTVANAPAAVPVGELANRLNDLDGIAHASPLSLADLGTDTLSAGSVTASGPAKIFGFDSDYADRDITIKLVAGSFDADGAVISAETADALSLTIGDSVTVRLPDDSTVALTVSGVADLSRSRSLFSSRRGGDLETFIYVRNAVAVSSAVFADVVQPAFDRAASARGERVKAPPINEVDITVDRQLLDSDPASALAQTQHIAATVDGVASDQDYLLDNISNTLAVAKDDAAVAKRLFVFLGVPGALLAAVLAAYSGTVLAEAQRREHATLRVRGASRRHLLRMLAMRTALLTAIGATIGLVVGYLATLAILGGQSLGQVNTSMLVRSAIIGTTAGLLATGTALYLTGRRSIDREINDDRARLAVHPPLWQRLRLDAIGLIVVVVGTTLAVRAHAFDGSAGSVYFGRSVTLNLALLVLPIAVWLTGSLLFARVVAAALARTQPRSSPQINRPVTRLYRLSIGRRPWAIGNAAIIICLIVALGTSLAGFTASYDGAKVRDARYANGADIRITPSPTARQPYTVDDADRFVAEGVPATTPVIYGLSNVILRSARTSDPANLAAVDPASYTDVAPLAGTEFTSPDLFGGLAADPDAVLLSVDMADFLKARVGDNVDVLLARATDDQVEVTLHVIGLFDRLPGFPDGADAVMSILRHTMMVPAKTPDFFLGTTNEASNAVLRRSVDALNAEPDMMTDFQIDTRLSTLARDQSSLAALNIAGLVDLDSAFALAMMVVAISIFVFGILLQRRREYVTLRAQGLRSRSVTGLITAEAATAAAVGTAAGLIVGAAMGYYFVRVLRPLFVLSPTYALPPSTVTPPIALVATATVIASLAASRLVGRLDPTELLRDE